MPAGPGVAAIKLPHRTLGGAAGFRTHKPFFHSRDRAGRPVCYYRTKLHAPKAFAPEETLHAVVYLYEELQARARREEACVVLDWTEGSFSNFDVEVGVV